DRVAAGEHALALDDRVDAHTLLLSERAAARPHRRLALRSSSEPSASRSRYCTPRERGEKRHAGLCEGFRSSDGASSRRAAWLYASADARPCALAASRPALGSDRRDERAFGGFLKKNRKQGLTIRRAP